MDLPTELKSRLSAYLQGNSGLEEFRVWFADVLRTVRQHDKSVRKLVWSVDSALASFGSGRVSRSELHEELWRMVGTIAGPTKTEVMVLSPPVFLIDPAETLALLEGKLSLGSFRVRYTIGPPVALESLSSSTSRSASPPLDGSLPLNQQSGIVLHEASISR